MIVLREIVHRLDRRVAVVWGLVAVLSLIASAVPASALDLSSLLSPLKPQQSAPQVAAPPPAPDLAIPAGTGEGKRVVYSTGGQRVWLVDESGALFGTWPVSGRVGAPYDGVYQVFSRSRHATAKSGRVVMQYMVRFARTPGLSIGFHSIPVTRRGGRPIQSEDELGQPRSSGCVRQRLSDAAAMWDFAPIGTTVVVIP